MNTFLSQFFFLLSILLPAGHCDVQAWSLYWGQPQISTFIAAQDLHKPSCHLHRSVVLGVPNNKKNLGYHLLRCFSVGIVSISRVINHMTCLNSVLSLVEITAFRLERKSWKGFFFRNRFSTNESTQIFKQVMWFITRLILTNSNWKPPSRRSYTLVSIGVSVVFWTYTRR